MNKPSFNWSNAHLNFPELDISTISPNSSQTLKESGEHSRFRETLEARTGINTAILQEAQNTGAQGSMILSDKVTSNTEAILSNSFTLEIPTADEFDTFIAERNTQTKLEAQPTNGPLATTTQLWRTRAPFPTLFAPDSDDEYPEGVYNPNKIASEKKKRENIPEFKATLEEVLPKDIWEILSPLFAKTKSREETHIQKLLSFFLSPEAPTKPGTPEWNAYNFKMDLNISLQETNTLWKLIRYGKILEYLLYEIGIPKNHPKEALEGYANIIQEHYINFLSDVKFLESFPEETPHIPHERFAHIQVKEIRKNFNEGKIYERYENSDFPEIAEKLFEHLRKECGILWQTGYIALTRIHERTQQEKIMETFRKAKEEEERQQETERRQEEEQNLAADLAKLSEEAKKQRLKNLEIARREAMAKEIQARREARIQGELLHQKIEDEWREYLESLKREWTLGNDDMRELLRLRRQSGKHIVDQ